MTYGSLFSGIGGFDLGFDRAGLECRWQVERDPSCLRVLEKHWPAVPKFTDVCSVGRHNLEPVDVVCGGFPCQDLSVAGRREGLDGGRSGLWHEFHRILEELRPRFCVIENVPGLLSSHGGKDFATVLRGLEELGYLCAWRTLDSRYFGVAQRRRRVFIVGSLGDGRAAEILFEPESLCRDPKKVRSPRKVAPTLFASGAGTDRVQAASRPRYPTASARSEADFLIAGPNGASIAKRHDGSEDGTGRGTPLVAAPRVARQNKGAFTDPVNDNVLCVDSRQDPVHDSEVSVPLGAKDNGHGDAVPGMSVRRLTPRECARLQGFPDDWNDFLASDGPRYRQFGNAVTVPVAEWIGRRLNFP